ncbi:hypothetical protein [Haloarchaeobius salinus]|uniref:hypothetical protein n=1 Tax=Haloarchaeobius salinus TaxID=1198298 RepID=UPI00210B0056|nr:hypothetical protein [Haloarchaeobius salinus]
MVTPDRKRGILTTDDRDYLNGRKNLQEGSERNARKRIRDRTRNAIYDFPYLVNGLSETDVSQVAIEDGEAHEEVFEAAEDAIAFLFRLCEHAPDTDGYTTDDRFRQLLRNGIEKSLNERQELTDFNLDLRYGLPADERDRIKRKLETGALLNLPEIRAAVEHDMIDDSSLFQPYDAVETPRGFDPKDMLSDNWYSDSSE